MLHTLESEMIIMNNSAIEIYLRRLLYFVLLKYENSFFTKVAFLSREIKRIATIKIIIILYISVYDIY